ncbi:MAG TPA: DUF4041 domain-containing protein [Candidatus Limnocylindria bacterium]
MADEASSSAEVVRLAADLAAERTRSEERLATVMRLRAEIANLRAAAPGPAPAAAPGDGEEQELQEVGIYRYHHPLETAVAYRERLTSLQRRIKDAVRGGGAIEASEMFIFDNSLAKGRKMTADLSKLMLRAYNAEADNCVRALRPSNVAATIRRLDAAARAIERHGSLMEMRVSPAYQALRREEIELTADFVVKQQEERERARDDRRRLREEQRAQKELEAERARLLKEQAHYANALAALEGRGDGEGTSELRRRLAEIAEAIAHNDFRLANIRAGYVYVISNRGSFGPRVVKIGLTRRLEPLDRVRELSGTAVPFPFDVHALFFSDDAVTLEAELHRAFAGTRVNRVNERREFFFATPDEVRTVLTAKVGNLLEFTDEPEALQFNQSRPYWPTTVGPA